MDARVTREFAIPDNCPKDIELMSILAQAYQEYAGELTIEQIEAATTWFKSWVDAEMADAKSNL